ncbi:MAG: acetyl-CoA decarbonylase/synthase complex subunit delta [Planctomycetes bacterium]|nr:acetyl-CoA decarbonylase/synthase complex subunit delta [Planctomycetota bacterium]
MAIPDIKENWSGRVSTVTIGATEAAGGTRGRTVTIGGASGIPFLSFDGETPNPPAIAMEVFDKEPTAWPKPLEDVYGDVWSDPPAWARRVKEFGADLVNLRLVSTHPDEGNRSAEEAVETVQAVLEAVDLPLIVWGCQVPEKDQKVMPKVAEATQGENCLLGAAGETDYRTITAATQAYGHKLIALAPCDINKTKQVNILISDMGYPLKDIVVYPTTAALGYGMEYIYSVLERGRLAALSGDSLLAQPVILDVGNEAWRAKEAKAGDEFADVWGPALQRGPAWEAVTAAIFLQGGVDLLVMCHPKAVETVRNAIDQLVGEQLTFPTQGTDLPLLQTTVSQGAAR